MLPLVLLAAQVWVVDCVPGPGVDFTSIQAAVDAAADGLPARTIHEAWPRSS